jgi:hypothetical protein
MHHEYLNRYTPAQQAQINRVRLHLQVETLSDLSDDTGFCIRSEYLQGQRPTSFREWPQWPRQPIVTKQQQRLWRRYVGSNFLQYDTKWINCLDITPPSCEPENIPLKPTHYPSLAAYLKSLPQWYQRLLFSYKQCAINIVIWQTSRSKKKVTIVSDGGLAESIGTFGWKILGANNDTLYAGAGPIDGSPDMGSSTRSELGGLAAPLFLVACLARLWVLKHKCRYNWIVDSKVAISKVTITTNADYLMVIRSLRRKLG